MILGRAQIFFELLALGDIQNRGDQARHLAIGTRKHRQKRAHPQHLAVRAHDSEFIACGLQRIDGALAHRQKTLTVVRMHLILKKRIFAGVLRDRPA